MVPTMPLEHFTTEELALTVRHRQVGAGWSHAYSTESIHERREERLLEDERTGCRGDYPRREGNRIETVLAGRADHRGNEPVSWDRIGIENENPATFRLTASRRDRPRAPHHPRVTLGFVDHPHTGVGLARARDQLARPICGSPVDDYHLEKRSFLGAEGAEAAPDPRDFVSCRDDDRHRFIRRQRCLTGGRRVYGSRTPPSWRQPEEHHEERRSLRDEETEGQ
jgi:hypothetical protein